MTKLDINIQCKMGIEIPKTYNISVKRNRKHYILTEANETPNGQSNPEQKEEH